MDKLDTIFAMQKQLNEDIIKRRGLSGIPAEVWMQRQTLALLSEMAELLAEINFKWWKNPKPVDQAAVEEELTDMLHFFISMCLSAGMSAEGLFERYLAKNAENFKRQDGTSVKKGYEAGNIS
ncbi:MAG: dUTPase [Oscillospiraceae bacterium]|jgi:dimeric dUTPase (all-alpha-NTP-PPase superfamily)|nr:dUTPase [Oscillospiraceae bacterium]